jgi:hypothetical protein
MLSRNPVSSLIPSYNARPLTGRSFDEPEEFYGGRETTCFGRPATCLFTELYAHGYSESLCNPPSAAAKYPGRDWRRLIEATAFGARAISECIDDRTGRCRSPFGGVHKNADLSRVMKNLIAVRQKAAP